MAWTAAAAVQRAKVTGGEVEGVVDQGIAVFKGIPFAAPRVAFIDEKQQVMVFDTKPHAQPVPNLDKLQALEHYCAWRRDQIRSKAAR